MAVSGGSRPVTATADWETFTDDGVTLRSPSGSVAARRTPDLLRQTGRAIDALGDLLEVEDDKRRTPVVVLLVDTDPPPADGAAEGAVTFGHVLRPEQSAAALLRPLTRHLLAHWFGPNAAASALFVDGLAGIVAARTGLGPKVAETDDWVRAEREAGRTVSVFAPPTADAGTTPADLNPVATSFVAEVLADAGPEAVRRFLASYDPDRRDAAAVEAFHRPLGSLEEGWLTDLEREPGQREAIQAFVHRLLPMLKPYRRRQAELVVYMVLNLAWGLTLPLASKYLFDTIIPDRNGGRLVRFLAFLLGIYVINALIGMRRAYVTTWISQHVLTDLAQRMFAHLQQLPLSFYARAKIGDLMSRLSSDLMVVQIALAQAMGTAIYLILAALAAAITLIVLSPLLGVLVLAVVPIFAVGYVSVRRRMQEESYIQQDLTGEAAAMVQENLAAQGVVKAFGLEEQSIRGYQGRLRALLQSTLRLMVTSALYETSISLATTLGQIIVLGVGGYLVIHHRISLGTLVAFIGLLPSLFSPIGALSSIGQSIQRASGALERINELLEEPVTITEKPDAVALAPLAREIRLNDVTFGYEPNRPILRDLTLAVPAGARVAIVGPSGCGKSSVINLLLRFWDPQEGSVCFDGIDVRDATLASLRGQIGLVFQETFVFDTTVRENIAIGRVGATDAEVAAAAQATELDEFIAGLPAGYDTVLGERGVRMSGGQRQRLAIARALVRDPRILVLDEATSALDPRTEAEIMATLDRVSRERTTISITHRLTSAAAADRIFVIEAGRLVEEGTHAALLAAGGLYARLYHEQTTGNREETAATDVAAPVGAAG